MSKTIFIPIEYLWDNENDTISERVVPGIFSHRDEETGEVYFDSHPKLAVGDRLLDIHPSYKEGSFTIIQGFHYSGFYGTCVEIRDSLGMPADTEIY